MNRNWSNVEDYYLKVATAFLSHSKCCEGRYLEKRLTEGLTL